MQERLTARGSDRSDIRQPTVTRYLTVVGGDQRPARLRQYAAPASVPDWQFVNRRR